MAGKPSGIKILKDNFENALKMAGISKIKLAAASGVQLRQIQRSVNQTGRMNYENLIAICTVLDADPRYIIESDFEEYRKWSNADNLSRDPFTGEVRPGWIEENKSRLDPDGIYIQPFYEYITRVTMNDFFGKLYEALDIYLMQFDFYSERSDEAKTVIINQLRHSVLTAIQKETDELSELWSLDPDDGIENED